MRGVGGPLLCIGDLLSDVDDNEGGGGDVVLSPKSPTIISPPISNLLDDDQLHPSHLTKLFQDNYDQLNKALSGTDHSWTALTLKLCTSLETANNLIQSTNSHVGVLSEKVEELERIINRRDSAIAAVEAIQGSLKHSGGALPAENS